MSNVIHVRNLKNRINDLVALEHYMTLHTKLFRQEKQGVDEMDIENQRAKQLNPDSPVNALMLSDERAIDELLINGIADFSVGEVELGDVLNGVTKNKALVSILTRLIAGDLMAISDLRVLTAGAANEKIQQMAKVSH